MRRSPTQAEAAEEKLRHWEGGSRDEAVREAAGAGMSVARIQKISGLATTTIMRILGNPPRLASAGHQGGRGMGLRHRPSPARQ